MGHGEMTPMLVAYKYNFHVAAQPWKWQWKWKWKRKWCSLISSCLRSGGVPCSQCNPEIISYLPCLPQYGDRTFGLRTVKTREIRKPGTNRDPSNVIPATPDHPTLKVASAPGTENLILALLDCAYDCPTSWLLDDDDAFLGTNHRAR